MVDGMAQRGRKPPRITLYGARGCVHCQQVRDWLGRHGYRFQELDVERNPRARKTLQRLGARGVPVLLAGDQRIDGFDPKRLRKLLG
ncbi:MAG: glutaredoxin family protein [Gammaproteobacteria bacterium]|nr:MAG: glutaredoxin family protein [Gammaproteobacteria bacterium]